VNSHIVTLLKKEPVIVITRPFGGYYHVNLEYDYWETHVGVYLFRRTAERKARKALKKKLAEYYRKPEQEYVNKITKLDLETWGS